MPLTARLSLSVPPAVKITSDGRAPSSWPAISRASSMRRRADPARAVQRRRVADRAEHSRHRLDGSGVHRGGGGVIEVDRLVGAHNRSRIAAGTRLTLNARSGRQRVPVARRAVSPRTAASHRAARSRRLVTGQLQRLDLHVHDRAAGGDEAADRRHQGVVADVGGHRRRCCRRGGGSSAAAAEPACPRRRRPGTSRAGTARTPGRTTWCPPGTRRRSGPRAAGRRPCSTTSGSRRRLARSIGMTFISRAGDPEAGPADQLGLGDERARHAPRRSRRCRPMTRAR